jgi:recombination protein RecT
METKTPAIQKPQSPIKSFFENPNVSKRFEEIIGDKTRSIQFISSVMQIASNNSYLKNADPLTIYNAALMAATLDLPINQNLGFAYIVPYGKAAQFQLGYKGLIQLAQRSGQYKSINVTEVYENQFKSFNALTEELDCDFSILGEGKVVGFAAYFKLLNGFEKTAYWAIEKVTAHGKKYSKTFSNGPWKTDFNAMAKKTVLKLTLATYGPLSVEVQKAITADQAIIRNEDGTDLEYTDHEEVAADPFITRIHDMIAAAENFDELEALLPDLPEELKEMYQEKYTSLIPSA